MRIFVSFPSLFGVLAAMSLASVALAQQEQRDGGRENRERNDGVGVLLQSRLIERSNMAHSGNGEYAMSIPMPRRERMTLEERRQLRRDINDAGRDIYRQTHRWHP